MKAKTFFPSLCLFSLFCLLLSGCGKNMTPVSKTDFCMDTSITVTLYDTGRLSYSDCEKLLDNCFSLCRSYEDMFSRTKEGSDIWNINHAGGAPVRVSAETAGLLQTALYYCRETDGAVDITIAPLSALWNFSSASLKGTDTHTLPDRQQIQALLPCVDYQKVQITGTTVTLKEPGAALDLGCIAKGYIADRLKDYLKEQGIGSAVINLGGNVLTLGSKPDGSPFRLGIQKPFDLRGTPIAVLSVSDASLVSSGVYERYFEADGILYHHLLNPRTGMPEQNGLLGVTILSDSSTDGDILSTACFLLGPDKGMAYVESLPGVEAVFITEDYVLHPSSGLSGLLQTP